MSQEKCPYCGGSEIVGSSITIGKTAETGDVGLEYKAAMIFGGTEPILADLCSGCGSITRLHVKKYRSKMDNGKAVTLWRCNSSDQAKDSRHAHFA